jgi:mono/diheme cytochrome c family protein
MKHTTLTWIVTATLMVVACKTNKKNTSTAAATPAPSSTSATTTTTGPFSPTKSPNGVNAPGSEELAAIQTQYPDATMDKLKEGHYLYTQGACIKCHGAKNIYKRDVGEWKHIVDEMAVKAKISDTEKDAVYKYVLAIKATQPK